MMKSIWASVALTLAGSASASMFAGDPAGPEGSTELVARVYNLGHLRMLTTDYEEEDFAMLPPSQSSPRMRGSEWNVLTDAFIGLVESVLWEEIEYDGRSMDSSGDEHLYLKAPESTHGDLRELLGFYERLCSAETTLQLFWVRVEAGSELPTGLISENAAIDWIDARANGDYVSDFFSVPAYRAAGVQQLRSTPFVVGADVEIAQGISTVDDVVHTVGSGHWAMAHAIPGDGGVQLSLTWADLGKPGFTEGALKLVSMQGAEGKPAGPVVQGGVIQLLQQSANMSSTRLFVPEGMASVSKVATAGGLTTLLIAVPTSVAPSEQTYQLNGPRKDRGIAFLKRSLLPMRTWWGLEGSFATSQHWGEQWGWRQQQDRSDWMAERALDGIADELVAYREVGGYIVLHTAHGVSRDQLPVAHMELDRAAQRLRDMVTHRPSYKVTLQGFQGDKKKVFHVEQVVAEGAQSTWFCGGERTYIHDYGVEVAQYASVHDPNVRAQLEGSLIELSVVPDAAGNLLIQIDAQFNLLVGSETMDFDSALHAAHDRSIYQRARFDTLQKLTGPPGGKDWTAMLGSFGEGAIYLAVKVQAIE